MPPAARGSRLYRVAPLVGLLAMLAGLLRPSAASQAPAICRVQGGHTKVVWGTGFTPGEMEVRSWRVPFDTNRAWAVLEATPYRGRDFLPATPPPDARPLNSLESELPDLVRAVEFDSDDNAEGFYDARAGGHVCWVRNRDGWSRPWLVTGAQPWWVSPEVVPPGSQVRVFGRTLDARLVALKRRADGRAANFALPPGGRGPLSWRPYV